MLPRREPRPPHRWRSRDVESAFVVGYFGTTHLPENGMMRPERQVWGAAVFEPEVSRPLLWRYQEGQGFAIHAVHEVFCGTRGTLRLACDEAAKWTRNATLDLEEGAESELAAVGTIAEFERLAGGLVRPTMRALTVLDLHADPGEPGGLDDFELWNWNGDRPVEPGAAVTTRDALTARQQ
jgi:hypothetical protein